MGVRKGPWGSVATSRGGALAKLGGASLDTVKADRKPMTGMDGNNVVAGFAEAQLPEGSLPGGGKAGNLRKVKQDSRMVVYRSQ